MYLVAFSMNHSSLDIWLMKRPRPRVKSNRKLYTFRGFFLKKLLSRTKHHLSGRAFTRAYGFPINHQINEPWHGCNEKVSYRILLLNGQSEHVTHAKIETCNFKVISNLLNLKQIKLITDIIEHVCTYFYVTILYKYYGSLQSEYVNNVTVDGKQ